ncbi:MAG: formylglycine-generating enzyme family protein [Candidatus Tectomicrobia bacterium]|nr:formylglycine-generating enzyme family protein [Candidatus Tectomicrobia bacterium]
MSRFALRVYIAIVCSLVLGRVATVSAESFSLPACAVDFRSEAVLNRATLDAMIAQAEPEGARPDRQNTMLFIVVKHYLSQNDHLLVLSRDDPAQPPILLGGDCLPAPEGASALPAPLNDLTPDQKQTLVTYWDLVGAMGGRVMGKAGAMASAENAGTSPRSVAVEGFSIDVYEVTNAEYRLFIEAQGYQTQTYWSEPGWDWAQSRGRQQPSYWDNEELNQPEQPVVGVTWYEADAYCRWAGKMLPTEEHWLQACQGPDQRKYPWGDSPLTMAEQEDGQSIGEVITAAVGSMPQTQSPYGVHDLAGSALEWTATQRDESGFILRGGSGPSASSHVGCNISHNLLPGMAANFIGFRCQSAETMSQ